jgi:hypothetical protein
VLPGKAAESLQWVSCTPKRDRGKQKPQRNALPTLWREFQSMSALDVSLGSELREPVFPSLSELNDLRSVGTNVNVHTITPTPLSLGQKAILEALGLFKRPKSELENTIRETLDDLKRKSQSLIDCLARRQSIAEEAYNRAAKELRGQAEQLLHETTLRINSELTEHGGPTTETEQNLKFYMQHLETIVRMTTVHEQFLRAGDQFESYLRDWHDRLVKTCIDALWDDSAIDRVLNIGSAITTAPGFLPSAAVASGIASTMLSVIHLKGKFSAARALHSGDAHMTQLEGALVLLRCAAQLTQSWLLTLQWF